MIQVELFIKHKNLNARHNYFYDTCINFLSIVRHITAFSYWVNFVISIVLEQLRLEIV